MNYYVMCVCVSVFGCLATTVGNVLRHDQGFLHVCVRERRGRAVLFALCSICSCGIRGLKVSGLSPRQFEINQITSGLSSAHRLAL